MRRRPQTTAASLRTRARGPVIALVALALVALGIRKLAGGPERPPPRKAAPIFRAQLQRDPPPPPKPAPTPPPVTPPKLEEPPSTRVELKALDIPPPDAPPPAPSAPAAGPLALAAAGDGPGDAFNLAGNPGGRGLLSGGGLGDGTGGGVGGDQDPRARFGWYYGKIASALETSLRGNKLVSSASTRVEVRVWTDASGRISRVQLVRSTGDAGLDQAIQAAVGLTVAAPPGDIPMPMVLRITARRPG